MLYNYHVICQAKTPEQCEVRVAHGRADVPGLLSARNLSINERQIVGTFYGTQVQTVWVIEPSRVILISKGESR